MRAAVCSILGAVICACGSAAGGGGSYGGSPSPDGGYGESPSPDGGSGPVAEIDPWKELVLVDSSVVLDARSSNANDGAWSFRELTERLGPGVQAESWLRTYRQTSLNGYAVEDRKGVEDLGDNSRNRL